MLTAAVKSSNLNFTSTLTLLQCCVILDENSQSDLQTLVLMMYVAKFIENTVLWKIDGNSCRYQIFKHCETRNWSKAINAIQFDVSGSV